MALTVEDGTAKTDADAFISVEFADTYHAGRGNATWDDGAESAKEQAIRRATAFLSSAFAWKGYPRLPRDQALAWPRTDVTDGEGWAVTATAVPWEIQHATAELALRELASPGVMTPDYTPHDRKSAAQVGPVSVTYDLIRMDAEGARPEVLIVRDLIGGFLRPTGSRIAGEVARV